MAFNVNVPGFAIDGSTGEFLLDGQPLSFAIEDMKWDAMATEELIHYVGSKDPKERTGGYREYTWDGNMPMRQLMLLAQEVGLNEDEDDLVEAITSHEFTLTINARPKNDPNIYTFTLERFRILKLPFNLGAKETSKCAIAGSYMKLGMKVSQ